MELSYKNDPALKALHVAQAEQHAAQDMLVSGTYSEMAGEVFRGCSVGCFAHDIDPGNDNYHAVVSKARGLPEWLVRLQDSMFEGLPAGERNGFHVDFAKRIPVGVDLTPLPHMLAIYRIDRMLATQRLALEAGHSKQVRSAISKVVSALEIGRQAHEYAAGGNSCGILAAVAQARAESASQAAARAARSADEEVAWSAAWSAAWLARSAWLEPQASAQEAVRAATLAAAWSAAWPAAQTARAVEREAAWSAAQAGAWIVERDALFACLAKLEP